MTRPKPRTPELIRPGFPPGLLGAIVLIAGLAVIGGELFVYVQYATCILASIMAVFAVQGRKWLWLLPLLAVAVVWNPIWPLQLADDLWSSLHLLGCAAFIGVGVFMRTPEQRHS
jgi:hypothetical protein